jgi:hypothetical protein
VVRGSPSASWLVTVAVRVWIVVGLVGLIVTVSTTGAVFVPSWTAWLPESVKVLPATGRSSQSKLVGWRVSLRTPKVV